MVAFDLEILQSASLFGQADKECKGMQYTIRENQAPVSGVQQTRVLRRSAERQCTLSSSLEFGSA